MSLLRHREKAQAFARHLQEKKSRHGSQDWQWYPYTSLANFDHLAELLGERYPELGQLLTSGTVLDAGCADGDFAFLLEHLGASVTAVDYSPTNFNGMRGVRAMREALGSNAGIEEWDLDGWPPDQVLDQRFDVGMALGILYHLGNPFLLLGALSRLSRYSLLSTRVLAGVPEVEGRPLAYLVKEDEMNADNSNYWLPTVAALRRMMERSGLEVGGVLTKQTADPTARHPWFAQDTRAFVAARSTHRMKNITAGEGWHDFHEDWRWASPRFTFTITGFPERAECLVMQVYVAPGLFVTKDRVEMQVTSRRQDGQEAATTFLLTQDGHQVFRVVEGFAGGSPTDRWEVAVRVDGRVHAPEDPRELAIVVRRLYLE